jgi:arabinan endo-1,5-alpha-L-arabinosidase
MLKLFNLILLVPVCLLSCKRNAGQDVNRPQKDTAKQVVIQYYNNPVFTSAMADPTVIQDPKSKLFYSYGTEDNWQDGKGEKLIPILESKDLIHWRYVGDAFMNKPNWKQEGYLWAPDVEYIGNKYFLYYAYSTWGDPNPGIGLAISDVPQGPFLDYGKLFDSNDIGVPNSIDPCYYADSNGNYLFWGSFSTAPNQGIYAIQLSEDSRHLKAGATKTKIAAGDFEGTMICKKGDYYYFFGSKGSCCDGINSTYHVLVARSTNLLGPYLDQNGNSILNRGNGTVILHGNDKFVGPGHNSNLITDKAGNDWILYHAYEKKAGATIRMLMLDGIKWIDGWPYIEGQSPSAAETKGPAF